MTGHSTLSVRNLSRELLNVLGECCNSLISDSTGKQFGFEEICILLGKVLVKIIVDTCSRKL